VRSVAFDGSVVNYLLDTPVGRLQGQAPGTGRIHEIGAATTVALDREALWAIPRPEDER
jgi:iron(III) transport system ATP-binding protein